MKTETIEYQREETEHEGVYRYIAPEGYEFFSDGFRYGTVVYGGETLTNYYQLKKIQ